MSFRICLPACCLIALHDKNLFLYHSIVCQKSFVKLPDVLVNLGKISTEQNRSLTRNLHPPALISTPGFEVVELFC